MSEAMNDARRVFWSAGLDEAEAEVAMGWVRAIPGDPRLVADRIVSVMNAYGVAHDAEEPT